MFKNVRKNFAKLLGLGCGFVLALTLVSAGGTPWLATPKLNTGWLRTYDMKCYTVYETAWVEDTYFYYADLSHSGYAGAQTLTVELMDEDSVGNEDDLLKTYKIYFSNGYPGDCDIIYSKQIKVDSEGDDGAELYTRMHVNIGTNGPNGMQYNFGID